MKASRTDGFTHAPTRMYVYEKKLDGCGGDGGGVNHDLTIKIVERLLIDFFPSRNDFRK